MNERYNTTAAADGTVLWRESRRTVDGRTVWRWVGEWTPRPERQPQPPAVASLSALWDTFEMDPLA